MAVNFHVLQHTGFVDYEGKGERPRVPAGSPRGGQWVSTKGATSAMTPESLPEGFIYDERSQHVADVHSNLGKITVGKKFFEMSKEQQDHVIQHEIGHALSNKMLKNDTAFQLADSGAFGPKAKDGTLFGINGQYTPGENVAEAVAVIHTEPKWLKEHYPEAYRVIGKRMIDEGANLPQSVVEDLQSLEGTIQIDKGSGGWGHVGRLAVHKSKVDKPRVPAGSSKGGQWVSTKGGSSKTRAQMTKEERKADVEMTTNQKWARVASFAKDRPKIMKQVEKDFATNDAAKVISLIDKTGFRVGGSRKRGEKEVFGASTLLPEHVSVKGDTISFNFLGKKAVQQDHMLKDKSLAGVISSRSKSDGKIFKTNDAQVRAYLKEVSGKEYLVKDLRTHVATSRASALISKMPVFKNKKEYNKAKNDICTAVSRILGNTPAMAKSSYINPKVWEGLRLEP